MIAAREHFHVIGFGNEAVDEPGRKVFDEFHQLNGDSILSNMQQLR